MKTTDFSLSKIGSIQKKLLFIYLIWLSAFIGTACFILLEAKGLGLILQENNSDSGLLVNQVLLLGLISLVGMSLMFFFLTRKILRPLRTLLQTTNELTSENLKVRAEVMADDEIGEWPTPLTKHTSQKLF